MVKANIMATKTTNNDIDDLNFSFGSTKKTSTQTASKAVAKAPVSASSSVGTVVPISYTGTVQTASYTGSVTTATVTSNTSVLESAVNEKTFKQPVVIPEGSSDALDSRYLINSTDDITGHTMWNTMVNGIYSSVYQGMQVYVKATKDVMTYVGPTTSNGVLVADASNLDYWVTMKTTANMDKIITAVTINHTDGVFDGYTSTASSDGTKLYIDIAGTNVPYKNGYISIADLPKIKKILNRDDVTITDKYPDMTTVINNIYDRITIEGNDI